MKKRVLSFILCVLMVITSVPVTCAMASETVPVADMDETTCDADVMLTGNDELLIGDQVDVSVESSSSFTPGNFSTTAEVVKFFEDLSAIQNGKYWNKGLDQNTLISQIKAGKFQDAVTVAGPCKDHNKDANGKIPNCMSNCFDSRWQCNGYAAYLAYILSGETNRNNTALWTNTVDTKNYIKGMTIDDLQPGDVIAYYNGNAWGGQHWIVVWKIVDGRLWVADCNGVSTAERCMVRFGEISKSMQDTILSNMQVHARCNKIEDVAHVSTESELRSALTRNAGTIQFNGIITLTADLTIPDGKNVTIIGGSITVPEGNKLINNGQITMGHYKGTEKGIITVNGEFVNNNDIDIYFGDLILNNSMINEGSILQFSPFMYNYLGVIHNTGIFQNNGRIRISSEYSRVVNDGTFVQDENAHFEISACYVAGIPYEYLSQSVSINTFQELKEQLSMGYKDLQVSVISDLTITQNLTIPENVSFYFLGDILTIPEGIRMTIETTQTFGSELSYDGMYATVNVDGELYCNGFVALRDRGTLNVNGTVVVNKDMQMQGKLNILDGGMLINNADITNNYGNPVDLTVSEMALLLNNGYIAGENEKTNSTDVSVTGTSYSYYGRPDLTPSEAADILERNGIAFGEVFVIWQARLKQPEDGVDATITVDNHDGTWYLFGYWGNVNGWGLAQVCYEPTSGLWFGNRWLSDYAVVLADSPDVPASGVCGDNVTWKLDQDGTLTISGEGPMYDYASNHPVPWNSMTDRIQKAVLEEGVTSIGGYAFRDCNNLTSVTIPKSVTSIEYSAFCGCSSLTSVTIPEGVTSIEHSAFWGCSSLTSVTIPEGVTSLGDSVFVHCSNLVSVTIPEGVTSIGKWTFSDCYSLTSVTIPEGVTSIGEYAFSDCYSLTSVTIPEGVTSIGEYAFSDCYSLTSVTIPEGVTSIGEHAFVSCHSLTSVTIPESVTSIGGSAFATYSNLEDVYYGGTQAKWEQLSNLPAANHIHYECTEPEGHWTWEYVEPSCTAPGYSQVTCPCGYIRDRQETPATGHTEKTVPAVDATCTKPGLTEGKRCSVCGEILVAQETVDALGHSWNGNSCDRCGAEEHFCEPYDYRYVHEVCHDLVCQCGKVLEEDLEHELTENGYCLCGAFRVEVDFNGGRDVQDETVTGIEVYCLGSFQLPVDDGEYLEDLNQIVIREGHSLLGLAYDAAGTRIYSGEEHTGSVTLYLIWEEEQSTPKPGSGFVDVVPGAYYEIPVQWAVEKGITAGVDATHFGPDQSCTRAHVVSFLWRAAGSPEPASSSSPFTDVAAGSFYYKAVLWAVEQGITAGTSDTTFSPNAECTRGQVVAFLWRAKGKPASGGTNGFTDVSSDSYCYDAVLWAVANGITAGTSATTFAPNAECTRGQVVAFLYRTYNN